MQREAARVARGAGRHLVHDVGPAHARVEVGEAERAAPAAVAERARVRPERQLAAGQHEAEPPADREPEHEVLAVALLGDGARRSSRSPSSRTPSSAPPQASARQHARHRARVAVAVGGGNLGAPPLRAVGELADGAAGCRSPGRAAIPGRWRRRRPPRALAGGRRHHLARRGRLRIRGEPDVEVGAERRGDLVAEERAERRAGDAPHDLADQVAVRQRVVAVGGAGLPPRRLGGERRRSCASQS